MKTSYDCVVVGGGPAGSTTAAIVAEGGVSTLLVEREAVPRFHVGESLMPETFWPLERLGLTERVKHAGWQAKKSVQFVTHKGNTSEPFFFREHDERECSTTWQVERSEFDKMIFDRAAELGADCYDQTRLVDVHAHMWAPRGLHQTTVWQYYANLAYGVTTTHDPSASTHTVFSQSLLCRL